MYNTEQGAVTPSVVLYEWEHTADPPLGVSVALAQTCPLYQMNNSDAFQDFS